MKECEPLLLALRGVFVHEVTGDLLEAKELVIGQQVNCLGIMGGGLAKYIKEKYPIVFKEYVALCEVDPKGRSLMGHCQWVEVKEDIVEENDTLFVYPENEGKIVKIVANLFGQHEIGTDRKRTEEAFLWKALEAMKEKAKKKGYSCALPYELGSRLGGGDWSEILGIIKEVFHDYPVTIYRLPM
ncbi:O-acetyl-ADP-ribose deacetylase (regulator of RNase III) [Paenibacillus sp. 1182]|uniref:Appr-1-p processing protein n=1 Tax=Paenibacillus sp. 1182 TaxID=2806565 RepID=UPI001B7B5FE2|nr:Appr-1-p processing protein [Paenibacillus sp. 1182]MBP1308842.1 O-acetyl-ADP-ribose deacetylase (regulator of RNase III) [Paenibacillus sp. 1182]